MHISPLYAAALALLRFVLSVRTLRLRRALGIPIGDLGEEQMLRAMRVHANLAEYVPITLLLIFVLEANGADALVVHGFCLCLLVGRPIPVESTIPGRQRDFPIILVLKIGPCYALQRFLHHCTMGWRSVISPLHSDNCKKLEFSGR